MNMNMNINDYYQEAHSGDIVDNTEILKYIKSFKRIILWGASYLGDSIGKELLNNDITINSYWDMRAEELKEINGIKVEKPFPETSIDKRDVLVILCIGNIAIMPNLLNRLKENEYFNVIRGDNLFMGLVCKFNKDTGIDGRICNGSMTCRSMFCRKLHNIVKKTNDKGGIF